MRKTKPSAVLTTFLLCFLFWLLLTRSFRWEELAAGGVVSLAAALFSARFFVHNKAFRFFHPRRLLAGLFYWVCVFPVELVKSNLHMAKLVLTGCRKIRPGIVRIPVGLKNAYAQAALANSITLTPGTITMEIAEQEGRIWYYVHWIEADCDGEEAAERIKGRMEKWIGRFWER